MGSWNEETQREAYLLNDPIVVYQSDRGRKTDDRIQPMVNGLRSLVSVSESNVIIETIKQAEDGDGIIVRLYESQRRRGQVKVKMGGEVESAWETNLLEENQSQLQVESNEVILNLRPYQILTMRIKFK